MWILEVLTTTTRRRWRNRNGGVKTAAWRTFRRRSTLHHAVKNKRVTVQGPVKKPQMDYMSLGGGGGGDTRQTFCNSNSDEIFVRNLFGVFKDLCR